MDTATAGRLARVLGCDLAAASSLGGQHGIRHYRLDLADGRTAFAKVLNPHSSGNGVAGAAVNHAAAADQAPASDDPAGFAAEAAGLRWLAAADAVPVPVVLAVAESFLVIEWLDGGAPSEQAAYRFGRELAGLHVAGSDHFGAPWPGVIAGLPLPNTPGSLPGLSGGWPDWYVANRVLPYARIARDAGTLSAADIELIESAAARSLELAGLPEPPSRLHGDCWVGNVLWSGGRGWLIDPAAHGGHRETDLAMLALFGSPYLDRIMAGYQEVAPLADGWRSRVPLHQLHPLLVHVCLFGAGYRTAALDAATAALSHRP